MKYICPKCGRELTVTKDYKGVHIACFKCHIGAIHESKKSAWELFNSAWGYLWEKKDEQARKSLDEKFANFQRYNK